MLVFFTILSLLEFQGRYLALFLSFLSNRRLHVVLDGKSSQDYQSSQFFIKIIDYFFKCILSFKLATSLFKNMLLPCSELSPLLLASVLKHWGLTSLVCAVQSAILNIHQCFCNLVTAGAKSLKCENKQLQLLLKRRKKSLWCAR